MISTLWDGNVIDPFLNRLNVLLCEAAYSSQPLATARSLLQPYLTLADSLTYSPLTTLCPPYIKVEDGDKLFTFFGGTSGQIHIAELLKAWNNPSDGPHWERGVCPAFAKAFEQWKAKEPVGYFDSFSRIYLVGHSYGGAVCECAAAIIKGQTSPPVRVWSYGSPRPGNQVLQVFLNSVENTRFYADDDPVRFIPPHSSENPALYYLTDTSLVFGMNSQVQPRTGYQIDAQGNILKYEGNPTALHAVGLSVASWVADTNGFRSVNHSPANYIARFNVAYVNNIPPKPPANPNPQEQRETLTTVRSRELQSQGEADLVRDATNPAGASADYEIPTHVDFGSPVRYKARKFGKIWAITLEGEVVAVGPGKRRAKSITRKWNRVMRAEEFIASALE